METNTAGLYIHVPFCRRKCPYCDFFSSSDLKLVKKYVKALKKEMELCRDISKAFDTIYMGGGTPSILTPRQVAGIIETANKCFRIVPDTEITLEVNPGTTNHKALTGYKKAGVNRLNIGVQAFDTKNLTFLGRIHTPTDNVEAIEGARKAGFENIGIDIIYGYYGQSVDDLKRDLKRAVHFAPEHISCYMLTLEPGVPFFEAHSQGNPKTVDEDTMAELFITASKFLVDAGYLHYEISNFARTENARSRHNIKYWTRRPYIGFGPSAHSYSDPDRFWNFQDIPHYIKTVESGEVPIEDREALGWEEKTTEAVYLGLRMTGGINVAEFEAAWDVNFHELFMDPINSLVAEGLMEFDGSVCRLTKNGLLFADGAAGIMTMAV